MNTSSIKDFDELPLFLNAQLVSRALGVSQSSAYELCMKTASHRCGSAAALSC